MFGNLLQDMRYALRALAKSPGFAAVAVLTVALGIGANTAIFSVIDAALTRPLPFHRPEELAQVWRVASQGFSIPRISYPAIQDWSQQKDLFAGMELYDPQSYATTAGDEPQRVIGSRVTVGLFELLGVRPLVGRTFRADEVAAGESVVVLSHTLWMRYFAGNPSAIGQRLQLDDKPFTVIGVMPPPFKFPYANVLLWTPLRVQPGAPDRSAYSVIARLHPGIGAERAQVRADALHRMWAAETPPRTGREIRIRDLHTQQVEPRNRQGLLVLFGAVAMVMVVACANAANLMLARAVARQRETALRAALGASRWRLLVQHLSESLAISLLAGGVGLLFAAWCKDVMLRLAPQSMILWSINDVVLDSRVVLFAVLLSVASGVIFGLAPAFRAWGVNLNDVLKSGGQAVSPSRTAAVLRNSLVVAQVTLTVILLAGAGVLIRNFMAMLRVDPGFDTQNLVAVDLSLPRWKYGTTEAARGFFQRSVERLRINPAVESVAVCGGLPPSGGGISFDLQIQAEGSADVHADPTMVLPFTEAGPEFFATARIPLLKGRAFMESDTGPSATPAIIVNAGMAKRFFPNGDAVGRRIRLRTDGKWRTVVGVVGDTYQMRPGNLPGAFEVYYPLDWNSGTRNQMTLIVRTRQDASRAIPGLKQQIWSLDAALPITKIATLDDLYHSFFAEPRFFMLLLGWLAALAVTLAAVGLFSVLSYSVRQRTREIGVRIALGAQGRDVVWQVVRNGLFLVVTGLALGLCIAVPLAGYLKGQLVQVSPTDPLTLVGVVVALVSVGIAASWLPAQHATRVDPMVALRHE